MQDAMRPIKIVLAEDEPMISLAYQKGLGFHGYDVVVAGDGAKALIAVQDHEPDILLLDIIMPHLNGIEVLERLRNDNRYKSLPVIVLTNLGQPSDAQRVDELGAKAYLIKANLSLKELVQYIEDALDKSVD